MTTEGTIGLGPCARGATMHRRHETSGLNHRVDSWVAALHMKSVDQRIDLISALVLQ
jgi:hypothetical protein